MVETRGMKRKREEKQKTENCENKSETESENGDDSNAINPLNMEDILHMVFLYLDIKSLKVARQVNKMWEGLALRRMLKVGFFIKVPKGFHKLSKEADEKVLKEIKPFISSNMSKIQNIVLNEGKDVQVLSSLGILGLQVKQLKIKEYPHIKNYEKLIMDQLVNLTHVTDSFNRCLSPEQVRLLFTFNNKPLVVPGIKLHDYTHALSYHLETLENISEGEIKTKKVVFDLMKLLVKYSPKILPRLSRILHQILFNSSETLEEICLAHAVGFLPDFEFPVLPRVKKLVISIQPLFSSSDHVYHQGLLLPPKFRFMESFPNLTQVELYCGAHGSEASEWFVIWINSFKNSGIAPQVKTVRNFNNNKNIKPDILYKVFPNARME